MSEVRLCKKQLQLTTKSLEMRMGHWIEAPILKWNHGKKTTLDLSRGGWHLENYFDRGDSLELILLQYPNKSKKFLAIISVTERTVSFEDKQYTIKEFEDWMK